MPAETRSIFKKIRASHRKPPERLSEKYRKSRKNQKFLTRKRRV